MRKRGVLILLATLAPAGALAQGPTTGYEMRPAEITATLPALPAVDGHTAAVVRAGLPAPRGGRVRLLPMAGQPFLKKFLEGGRADDWGRRQGRRAPQAIVIERGVVGLGELAGLLKSPGAIGRDGQAVALRRPLLILPGATLLVDGRDAAWLRLEREAGAFLVNAGTLYVVDARVSSWSGDAPAEAGPGFRPFIAAFGGSRTVVAAGEIDHLGYDAPKAYGLSFSPGLQPGERPTGLIVDSHIHHNRDGIYADAAGRLVLVGNRLRQNLRHGFDLRNGSEAPVVARNSVAGNGRGGIALAAGVTGAAVFENDISHNGGNGIALTRGSTGNLVARNQLRGNGGYGLAVLEAPGNQVWDNLVAGNDHGVRLRDSRDVTVAGNAIRDNGRAAIHGSGAAGPSSMAIFDNRLAGNSRGLTVGGFSDLTLGRLDASGRGLFGGDLLAMRDMLTERLVRGHGDAPLMLTRPAPAAPPGRRPPEPR